MRVLVRGKLVVVFWELIPMELGANNSAYQDTATDTKQNQKPEKLQQSDLWWKEENCSMLMNAPERLRKPTLDGVCDDGYLELRQNTIPSMKVSNCL